MKDLGIVRRIDELGRIVIPIEIRRNMRVRSGDEMEMFINDNADIVIRRYTRIRSIEEKLTVYLEALKNKNYETIYITSLTNIILAHTQGSDDTTGSFLAMEMYEVLNSRSLKHLSNSNIPIFIGDTTNYNELVIVPIIANGDLYGGLVVGSNKCINECDKEWLIVLSEIIACELI